MKRYFAILILSLATASSFARDVEVDGVCYNLYNEDKTAAVTFGGSDPEEPYYFGEVIIPACFSYNLLLLLCCLI